VMEKRENKLSMLMKMQSDEISALNNRYDAMKKSLNDRYLGDLSTFSTMYLYVSNCEKLSSFKMIGLLELIMATCLSYVMRFRLLNTLVFSKSCL